MTVLTSGLGPVEFGPGNPTLLVNAHLRVYDDIGLNQEVLQTLLRKDFGILIDRARQSIEQWGCKVVDICLDAHDIDEPALLPEVVMAVHEATGLAMSLDTRNPEALRRTLRVYPHKTLINSIPGEEVHIRNLMPLVSEFHTAVVLILTDEGSIPETVAGRLRVAERLIKAAQSYGIRMDDIVVDPVCMPSSAVEGALQTTFETMHALRREYGCSTILGVTNAGFGMPAPGLIDLAYILAAMAQGLDAVLAVNDVPVIPMLYPSVMAMDFLTGRDVAGRAYLAACRADPLAFGDATVQVRQPRRQSSDRRKSAGGTVRERTGE